MAENSTIARPYAKALFEVASEARELGGWSTALAVAARVVGDAAVRRYLGKPDVDAAQRARFLAELCEGLEGAELLASSTGRNMLMLLSENDRLVALPEIAAQFDAFKAQAEHTVKATLVAATAVDAAQAARMAQALERKLGRKVDLELELDPTLVGGAIVRADDKVIDGSVRARLQRLAETLID